MQNRIAILATGDELTTGDILNTTSQYLAHELTEIGFNVTALVTVSDDKEYMIKTLASLLEDNNIIITTGGLGPTSDDITRFALAEVTKNELLFDEKSWQHICARLTKFNVPITENNRQQALFPLNAVIFENQNGTANGCRFDFQQHHFYMLPGPPYECREMFKNLVLPDILSLNLHQARYQKKWRLFAVSESDIASTIENKFTLPNINWGYRIDYPYLELKLLAPDLKTLETLSPQVSKELKSKFLSDEYTLASDVLIEHLSKLSTSIYITDKATAGFLQQTLSPTRVHSKILFAPSEKPPTENCLFIELTGLQEIVFPSEDNSVTSYMTITSQLGNECLHHQEAIPNRGLRSLRYATEWFCAYLLKLLQQKALC